MGKAGKGRNKHVLSFFNNKLPCDLAGDCEMFIVLNKLRYVFLMLAS